MFVHPFLSDYHFNFILTVKLLMEQKTTDKKAAHWCSIRESMSLAVRCVDKEGPSKALAHLWHAINVSKDAGLLHQNFFPLVE
jgi:hypothetical protein